MTSLVSHYRKVMEGDRLFLSRANSIEFYTTCHFIEKYLETDSRIIELGAGHGAYSLYFSHKGHEVLATDIVRENVAAIGELIEAEKPENLSCRQLDASEMGDIGDNSFDLTLCLGPLYHLRNADSRARCIKESARITRKGGVIAFAYINRVFALPYMQSLGVVFSEEDYRAVEKEKWESHTFPDDFMNISHFSYPELMVGELAGHGLTCLSHIAADGPYTILKSRTEEMSERAFSDLLQYHIGMAERPSSLGASSHNLVICRKGE